MIVIISFSKAKMLACSSIWGMISAILTCISRHLRRLCKYSRRSLHGSSHSR